MLKILLADDSMTAQNMGKKILTDAGYDVVTVSNGAAAVKKIPEANPDLVLLDIYMPGYNGLEVCELMKSDPQTAHIPVLLTVGKLEPFRPEDGMRVKAEGVVIKPFEATDLLTVVSKMAERIPPPPVPVKPVAVPTIAIPDYGYVEPAAEPEPAPGISWGSATMPAFEDDLLATPEPGAHNDNPFLQDLPSQAAAPGAAAAPASPFSDFAIELEPLPLEPASDQQNPNPFDSGAALPVEFEIDEAAAGASTGSDQQHSSDAVLDFVPFMPEASAPEQALVEASFEAAMNASETPLLDEVTVDEKNPPAPYLEAISDSSRPFEGVVPEIELAEDGALAENLSRTLREALAAVEQPQSGASESPEAAAVYDLDLGSTPDSSAAPVVNVPEPAFVAPLPRTEEAVSRELPEPVIPEAMGAVIDLDSILREPAATAEPEAVPGFANEAAEPTLAQADPQSDVLQEPSAPFPSMDEQLTAIGQPAVAGIAVAFETAQEPEAAIPLEISTQRAGEAPAVAPETAATENDFDVNLAIAEQVAERVLQRLKPQLVEEIRNVLKEM